MNTEFKNIIENNFNNESIYTTSKGKDLKNDIRVMANKQGKKITDFTIIKIK